MSHEPEEEEEEKSPEEVQLEVCLPTISWTRKGAVQGLRKGLWVRLQVCGSGEVTFPGPRLSPTQEAIAIRLEAIAIRVGGHRY